MVGEGGRGKRKQRQREGRKKNRQSGGEKSGMREQKR